MAKRRLPICKGKRSKAGNSWYATLPGDGSKTLLTGLAGDPEEGKGPRRTEERGILRVPVATFASSGWRQCLGDPVQQTNRHRRLEALL